ncbi:site-specific integrase [Bacillus haynesii]|nr:site-specific integrase [Bacillus haynesii]MCY8540075.1 site-specific integrase [Bacillus haynesii]
MDAPSDPVTGERKQIARRGNTKKEAERRALKALETITEEGLLYPKERNNITFEKLAAEWLESYATGVKSSSVKLREKQIKFLKRYISKIPVQNISPKMYQNILNKMHREEYSRNTILGAHSAANQIFKCAINWNIIKSSPTDGAKIPTSKLTVEQIENKGFSIEQKYLERDELQELLTVVEQHGLFNDEAIFNTLAFTGMRVGELCALKIPDVNLKDDQIRITKTLFSPNNRMDEFELLTPKTLGSIRVIDIDEYTKGILQKQIKFVKELMMENRKHYYDEGFLFPHKNGYPFMPKKVGIRMNRLVKQSNIQKKVSPHTLRHTHISMLTEAGVDLKEIMERVGHTDMRTTIEIYTHVTNKMKKETSNKMKCYLQGITSLKTEKM